MGIAAGCRSHRMHSACTSWPQVRCHSSFDLLASLAVIRPLMAHLVAHGGVRCVVDSRWQL